MWDNLILVPLDAFEDRLTFDQLGYHIFFFPMLRSYFFFVPATKWVVQLLTTGAAYDHVTKKYQTQASIERLS